MAQAIFFESGDANHTVHNKTEAAADSFPLVARASSGYYGG
jgi:hypothetical protein